MSAQHFSLVKWKEGECILPGYRSKSTDVPSQSSQDCSRVNRLEGNSWFFWAHSLHSAAFCIRSCSMLQRVPSRAMTQESVVKDCAYIREASVSNSSGPDKQRAADLAVIIPSKFLECFLPWKAVLLVAISTASPWCLHNITNYTLTKKSCCPYISA